MREPYHCDNCTNTMNCGTPRPCDENYIEKLETKLDAVRALPEKWRNIRFVEEHGRPPPEDGNAAEYADEAKRECADELDKALQGDEK